MNVVFISTSDNSGGAAIACSRLQRALTTHLEIEGAILVQDKKTNNPAVVSVTQTSLQKKMAWIKFVAERLCFLPYEKSKEVRFLFNQLCGPFMICGLLLAAVITVAYAKILSSLVVIVNFCAILREMIFRLRIGYLSRGHMTGLLLSVAAVG